LLLEKFVGQLFHALLQEENALLQEQRDLLQEQTALSQLQNVLSFEASALLRLQESVSREQLALLLLEDDGSFLFGDREDVEAFRASISLSRSAVRERSFPPTFFQSDV
jgi:hypothetical protein